MHSKYKIWDFIKQNENTITSSSDGLVCIYSYEPLFNHILIENIYQKFDNYKSLRAKELGPTWVEDNLNSLSLFGNTESYIINQAEDLSEDVKESLFSSSLDLSDRSVILIFNKSDKAFQKISKNKDIKSYSIVEHPFWEADKLLDFVLSKFHLRLSYEAKEYVLEVVNNSYIDFLNLSSKLELSFKDSEVSKAMLEDLIVKNRVDNFEFARLFGYKNSKAFYKKIIDTPLSFDEMRALFYFLQTHMLKIASTDHIYKKTKQTKYDKQILEQSKIWKSHELDLSITFLKKLEFMAKLKNPLILNDLKSSRLRSLL